MAKKKKRPADDDRPKLIHDRFCCGGSGLLQGSPITHKNGMTYDKVSVRCPGRPATPSAPPTDPYTEKRSDA